MSVSFNDTFAYYGDSQSTLLNEILADVSRSVTTTIGTLPFSRNTGFGFEALENETFSQEMVIYITYLIANSISLYNQAVIPDRKVISSQELISFEFDQTGELLISIYVIPLITMQPVLLTI